MRAFELSIDNNLYSEWKILLSERVNKSLNIIESIENDKKISIDSTIKIQMFLVNILENKKDRKEAPYKSDILYWTDDITLGAYSPYKGIIISKKLKNILLNYTLPPYHLYSVEIINSENLEINNDYFLFYIKGKIIDLTLFNKSEYTYYKRRKEIKKSIGDFNNYEEFNNEYRNAFNEGIKIKITNRVISNESDLIPSSLNYLIVNEEFLKEQDKLRGITFKELINIEIKNAP